MKAMTWVCQNCSSVTFLSIAVQTVHATCPKCRFTQMSFVLNGKITRVQVSERGNKVLLKEGTK